MNRAAAALLALAATTAGRPATVVLPASPAPEEVRAAGELGRIWKGATGRAADVREESSVSPAASAPIFYLGDTAVARRNAPLATGGDPDGFCVLTLAGDRVVVRGSRPLATELGVYWYARTILGVRWYRPGPIGEEIPALSGWHPPRIDRWVEPGFTSRSLGTDGEWARHNGLDERIPNGHALAALFPPDLFAAHPEWFPLLDGIRRPPAPGDHDWQPNLALPEVAAHAAAAAAAFFGRNPAAPAFSISINDSDRFDQSEATIRARGPLRWFRGRPDYSDLVFGFVDRAADALAKTHPDKRLAAYAYGWCENAPSIAVRPNVVPWIASDQSEAFDPDFARDERELVSRWCRSGAGLVGLYDYLEGDPYLIPRQTARLSAAEIQSAYGAGVRAYAAEGGPNWGLDGPKLWLVSQILWQPGQSPEALLDDYYRGYWREAAAPMRAFDRLCEAAWREQPRPGWWLKYYRDESQTGLFPLPLRARLRGLIREASSLARDRRVRDRVEQVSAAFAVSERFAEFCEARTALSDAAESDLAAADVARLLDQYRQRKAAIAPAVDRAVQLGALSPVGLEPYLRNDPGPRAEARLEIGPSGFGPNLIGDPDWSSVGAPPRLDDRTFWWSRGLWLGWGEPAEGRAIALRRDAVRGAVVRFAHARAEALFQWVRVEPGRTYRAEALFRGRVSPGNESFLVVGWRNGRGAPVGATVSDQIPAGDWEKPRRLLLTARAPADAAWAGIGLEAFNQYGEDWAEFSEPSLRAR